MPESSPKTPTFTAMIANYNDGADIHKAIAAAKNQTYPFDEILIIDDGSSDNSVDIINELIKDIPTARLIEHETNKGVVTVMITGVENAGSDFIYYMSAGDNYHPHVVETAKEAIETYPDVAMVSGNIRLENIETGKERLVTLPFAQTLQRYTRSDIEKICEKQMFTFLGGGNMIRCDAIKATRALRPELEWNSDWFLYFLIGYHYPFAVVPKEFCTFYQSSDQYSAACHNWKRQRPVTEYFLTIISKEYPEEYIFFRRYAILPIHSLQALPIMMAHADFRRFITPLLVWRTLIFNASYRAKAFIPDHLRRKLRVLIRT